MKEVWGLLALEATLFLSIPCWELTASWAQPVSFPFRFYVSLLVAATVAMLACHIGPAALGARFGERQRGRFLPVLLLWLGFGYLAWMLNMARASGPYLTAAGVLVLVTVVAWIGSSWKYFAVGGALMGAGILVWALATTWRGLWARNLRFAEPPAQFDWPIIWGLLLSAAPAVVVAWRIGCLEPEPRRIWRNGLLGVWLPVVSSVTVASLADQAGLNLYWVPSFPRGFNWALLGSQGRLTPTVIAIVTSTLVFPALLSAVSLRLLLPLRSSSSRRWSIFAFLCVLTCAVISQTWNYGGVYSLIDMPAHRFWAASVLVLGALAGVITLAGRGLSDRGRR